MAAAAAAAVDGSADGGCCSATTAGAAAAALAGWPDEPLPCVLGVSVRHGSMVEAGGEAAEEARRAVGEAAAVLPLRSARSSDAGRGTPGRAHRVVRASVGVPSTAVTMRPSVSSGVVCITRAGGAVGGRQAAAAPAEARTVGRMCSVRADCPCLRRLIRGRALRFCGLRVCTASVWGGVEKATRPLRRVGDPRGGRPSGRVEWDASIAGVQPPVSNCDGPR